MAALKDEFSRASAAVLADAVQAAWPAFDRRRFLRGIDAALEPLELRARVDELARRLVASLPDEFPAAAEVLHRALDDPALTGWIVMPVGDAAAAAGIDEPEVALPLLAALTPRFSSEFPVRPFIERHPEVTFAHLDRWADDPDEHVRRLVSEGTRPRLPWAPVLRGFVADPSPCLSLLDRLHDDPSAFVRLSVSNHLNDIARDHPDIALDRARRWLAALDERDAVGPEVDRAVGPVGPGALGPRARRPEVTRVVTHGLRTLVKRGIPDALVLLGVAPDADIRLTDLVLERDRVAIGEAATMTFTLELAGDAPTEAVIDYRVHYVGASGPKAPKVFKLSRRRLVPGAPVTIVRSHRFAHVSIRRIRPGPHAVDVQVNGRVLGTVIVEVVDDERD